MTKILYIPSGEYIKFITTSDTWTEEFTKSDNMVYEDSNTPEKYINKVIEHNFSSFLIKKYGKIQHYREEFEIIYD